MSERKVRQERLRLWTESDARYRQGVDDAVLEIDAILDEWMERLKKAQEKITDTRLVWNYDATSQIKALFRNKGELPWSPLLEGEDG